jgi:hypothetical protein
MSRESLAKAAVDAFSSYILITLLISELIDLICLLVTVVFVGILVAE